MVTPVIDVISAETLEYERDYGLPSIGVFDWTLTFTWQGIQRRHVKYIRADPSLPIPSPTMAGGLFSIDRGYFLEQGMYDPGFEIWGAENLELSFKVRYSFSPQILVIN